ncbi:MAG: N-6 DNA methylase [Verrucomicrobia bacterium]|nr:N-6 DNA methylase [Verrucomicrobiota bacterium]
MKKRRKEKIGKTPSQKICRYSATSRAGGSILGEEEQLQLLDEPLALPPPVNGDSAHRYRKNGAREKVLGAVYTPPRVAAALTRWAVRVRTDVVLDPSCGEGVFLSAARTRLADLGARKPQCIGVDIDAETAALAGAVGADFFAWARTSPKLDVIVGNPPFIRSHLFPEASRTLAFPALERLGLHPSRLMSTWAPFLAISCGLLTPSGRIAMVIPEELLAVGYAKELREFLLRSFRRVIVCFPDANIFPEVQQAVVLLMCDNQPGVPAGLLTIDYSDLEEGNHTALQSAPLWKWNQKWSHLFLSPCERRCLNDWWTVLNWQPFNEYGRVEVGIVTGDNDYFILRQRETERFPHRHLVPIITSARDLRGIQFGAEDFRQVVSEDRPAFLLSIHEPRQMLGAAEQEYLNMGERRKVSTRYKCRVREPWYAVPSVWEPNAVLLRQAGDMSRVVHLAKKCAATDTIHRVTWNQPSCGRRHAASFLNTWTLLASELTGRSYGGGVLELMPGEANQLPLPEPVKALDEIFDAVDERVRSRDFFAAIETVDGVVLPKHMMRQERSALREILDKLIQRRKMKNLRDSVRKD